MMEPLETRPLFRYRAELASPQQNIGATYAGRRTIALVTGGEVQGERIHGKVLNGGGDWASIDEQDRLRLDVRLTIETHDAALIYVRYAGVLRPLSLAVEQASRGGPRDPEEAKALYFRTTPVFEAGDPRYDWLNGIIAVGVGRVLGGAVEYDVHEVL